MGRHSVGRAGSCALTAFNSQAQAKRNVLQAVEVVAQRLGNTRAVCRKCYIHPDVVNAYLDGTLEKSLNRKAAASWCRISVIFHGRKPPCWRSFSATASSGSGSPEASASRPSGSSCQGTSRRRRSILRLRAMANTQVVMLPFSLA